MRIGQNRLERIGGLEVGAIVDREADYCSVGYHHIWVVGPQIDRLSQKAFGDIHNSAGGRILVIDPVSVAATARSSELHLRELSLPPSLANGMAVWTTNLVGTDIIMMSPAATETLADATFGALRHRIRDNAAAGLPLEVVRRDWDAIVAYLNGDPHHRAALDKIGDVLAFLQQVEVCCMDLTVETDAAMLCELQRRLDVLLKTWGWSPLFALVQQLVPALEFAMTPVQAKACLTPPASVVPP